MRLRAKRRARTWFALAGLVVGSTGCGGDGAADADRPHVLLISLDSTRRDLLSCYGFEAPHAPGVPSSPRLDALAAEGVLFEDAVSTTSWTLPSHWSLLTGEPELVHAVDLDHHRPAPQVVPLAERLQQAGYRTAGFVSGPYLEAHFGFDRGFDRYEVCYGEELQRASARAAELRRRHAAAVGTGDASRVASAQAALTEAETELQRASHRDVSGEEVARRAVEELERAAQGGGPAFVFAHFFDPHFDHVAPAPYADRFDPVYGSADGHGDWSEFMQNPALSRPVPGGEFGLREQVATPRELEHVWADYAAELAWTDAAVGRLLDALDAAGLAEDTLVVVTSDHGDEFFEHSGLGHRRTLFEEVTAVPLLLRFPGRLPAGARVDGVASTTQVAPTILELAGLPADTRASASGLGGSLVARAQGEAPPPPALGRFVQLVPAFLQLRDGAGRPVERVEVRQVRLFESWHDGDLKLLREARWVEPLAGTSPSAARQVRGERGREARVESLRWIDLVAHPDEAPAAWSEDFTEPDAAAALARWQDAYGRLLAQRGEASVASSEAFRTQLDALGYGGSASEAAGDAFGSVALTLPVPRPTDESPSESGTGED